VVPQVLRESRQLAEKIPIYASRMQGKCSPGSTIRQNSCEKFLKHQPDTGSSTNAVTATNARRYQRTVCFPDPSLTATSDWSTIIDARTLQSATALAGQSAAESGGWLFGQVSKVAAWFGVLAGVALIPVYAFYFLLEKQGIEKKDRLPAGREVGV